MKTYNELMIFCEVYDAQKLEEKERGENTSYSDEVSTKWRYVVNIIKIDRQVALLKQFISESYDYRQ